MSDLLRQEALFLCDCSPVKSKPKTPSGSKSRLTQMSKYGVGPAHCIVQPWPSHNTPAQWEKRNPVLLNDPVPPQIWGSLGDEYIAVKRDEVRCCETNRKHNTKERTGVLLLVLMS